jgi:demethylmenaquinone methyltransferase/2-methoxy-6-polyprenyl-1,4-benzoquinol methylase
MPSESSSRPVAGQAPGKRADVAAMFDRIAPRYDLLNRVLSLGIDKLWRRTTLREMRRRLDGRPAGRVLDLATGTADLAIALARRDAEQVVGVDPSVGMLEVGREKVMARKLDRRVTLEEGHSEQLPFEDDLFDAATVAFGVRNYEDLQAGLRETARVLKPEAPLVVLEFSRPTAFPIKQFYGFYFRHVLPRIGGMVSGDAGAYTYLPESVNVFPDGDDFLREMERAGFTAPRRKPLTFGIATVYSALASGHRETGGLGDRKG